MEHGTPSSHPKDPRKGYMVIFAVLAILTVIEIWAATTLHGHAKLWSLIGLAVAKAVCVALFYMHLKFETSWLKFIAATPILMGFYVYALSYEVLYR